MSCNIDGPLSAAKSALNSQTNAYKSKLGQLRNLSPKNFNSRADYERAKADLSKEVKDSQNQLKNAVNDYNNIGGGLNPVTQGSVEQIADLFTTVFSSVPSLGPIALLVSALKDQQC